jgi:hypothetical protein
MPYFLPSRLTSYFKSMLAKRFCLSAMLIVNTNGFALLI